MPTPAPLPDGARRVDLIEVDVLGGVQADTSSPDGSVLWIPSQRILIADDSAFDGVHIWLAESSPAMRAAWRASLDRLAALRPEIVVPGHTRAPAGERDPAVLARTRQYLDDFEASLSAAHDAAASRPR